MPVIRRSSIRQFVSRMFLTTVTLIALTGCSNSPQGEHMYTFRALKEEKLQYGTSKVNGPSLAKMQDLAGQGKFGEYTAAFRGAVLKLFGTPLWSSDDGENAYGYVIEVSDKSGKTWILTVYQGPSGPAIGGNSRDESILLVSEALMREFETTLPDDFDAVTYIEDYDTTVAYGCKDGKCYYDETAGKHLSE
jgi:hypothetical protein